ncbi:hypothetical protein ETU09_05010 [Apibacter muscae]|uniref:YcxB family protein n=1 Tax=Apibacter muscae TaxID=2509004 RepID=A0A563DF26_9FLAO|nr:hypothetical protein [Apibacter muscae]TWP28679.1 hypothetical protein ETU09_05010 [Apibacter muscae]
MKLQENLYSYTIGAEDYLTHQLFSATNNENFKKQRKKGLLIWTLLFGILALVFFIQKNFLLTIYFIIFGVIFFFVYPYYSSWVYKRYFKRIVQRNFANDKEAVTLKITSENFILSNQKEQGTLAIADLESINEIATHLFLRFKDGKNIIIPMLEVENKNLLLNQMSSLAQENSFSYYKNLNWKWK